MSKRGKIGLTIITIGALLAMIAVGCLPRGEQEMGVTNLSSLHLSDVNETATPVFIADQQGTGAIALFEDAGTPVFSIYDGGAIAASGSWEMSGGVDLNGAALTIDADADTALQSSLDDTVTLTLGAATGHFNIATGNLRIGNGTPGETHNGEDFYVEGISEFDGSAYFDGAVDMDSTLDVDGATNLDDVDIDLSASLNIDGHMLDVGTGTYSRANGDNDVGIAGDLEVVGTAELDGAATIGGNLIVTGTSLLGGNATFSGLMILSSTRITVAEHSNDIFTPTVTIYRLDAAAGVVITLTACSNTGQMLYFYGEDNQTISVGDSNIYTHDGAADTFGQYDVMSLVCIGTKWVQLGVVAANS